MCFSAPASFVASAVIGGAGIGAILKVDDKRSLLFAAIPLFFSLQQAIEGLLWLALPNAPDGPGTVFLTHAFLFFALVFWPVYAPLAALLIEPDPQRKALIRTFLGLGVAVAAYLVWSGLNATHTARMSNGHIIYVLEPYPPRLVGLAYIAATAGGTLLSTIPAVRLFGAVVLTGSILAYAAYWEAFLSVWCFFAAVASGVILVHFARLRQIGDAVPSRSPAKS